MQAQVQTDPHVLNPAGVGLSAPHHLFAPARFSTAAPSVRRALTLMMCPLDEPLSMTRLATASGMSKRTLHRVVSRDFGLPPIALSRRMRLLEVRAELQAPRRNTTVTEAALRWGFTHLGRFAGEYAREFGERPSQTLRRAKAERDRRTVYLPDSVGSQTKMPPSAMRLR